MNQVSISPERQAWELFEVGSLEDVIRMADSYQNKASITHLKILAEYELEQGDISAAMQAREQSSVFSDLIGSYIANQLQDKIEAFARFQAYIQTKNRPLCFSIINYGVKLAYQTKNFAACLRIIHLDKSLSLGESFLVEKMDCLYYLKKYKEFIYFFRTKYQFLESHIDMQLKAGLALQALGKFKESEAILSRVPEKAKLPSFDQKRQSFAGTIERIPDLENKSSLSFEEWKDLGFAYLFNSQFKEAEEAFKKAAQTIE